MGNLGPALARQKEERVPLPSGKHQPELRVAKHLRHDPTRELDHRRPSFVSVEL